jgi:hypothetical protein
MQYLLYCVICFRVWSAIKEVFVVGPIDVVLASHRVFMQRHTHDAKVASAWYKKANGIPSPFDNDTYSP